jgi:hypothetical protein
MWLSLKSHRRCGKGNQQAQIDVRVGAIILGQAARRVQGDLRDQRMDCQIGGLQDRLGFR